MGEDDPRHDDVATILEFFGIKLTTPNQQLAEFLKIDVVELMRKDVRDLFRKARADAHRDAGHAAPTE